MSVRSEKSSKVLPSVLFACLESDLGMSSDSTLPPNVTPQAFAKYQLLRSFYKKYVEHVEADADQKALEKFLQVNQRCRDWELVLEDSRDEELLGELKNSLYNFFYPRGMPLLTHPYQFLDRAKVGPGASVGARGYDFYTKLFSSPLTSTSVFLYETYRNYVWSFPEFSNAETIRVENFGGPSIVQGNRLSFVPKSVDISRTISVEPSLNMFFQLGLKDILEERLVNAFGIDLRSQQAKNRELARLGSIEGGPGFATIDLSSASDSISKKMLREVLPRSVMNWLELLRSPTCRLPNGELVELEMISTMGNGFTFPLQTILFSCVVIAASRVYDIPVKFPYGSSLGNFGVNGDDIICYPKVARGVLRLLSILGFEVNRDKTFIEGPFRESCGADFYQGQWVRGVFVKDLSSPASRYALINALNLWSSRTGIPVPLTVQYLLSTVRYLPVPLWENADAGVRVPYFLVRPLLRKHKGYQSTLYECLVPKRTVIWIDERSVNVPRGSKRRIYNPSGLLMAVLNGSIRSGTIGLRLETSRYLTKRRIAPNWDYSETSSDVASDERGDVWEYICTLNLGLEKA